MIQRNGSMSQKIVAEIRCLTWKRKKHEQNEDLWENIKHTNICIIGVPEGEERENKAENRIEGILTENVPNLGKETDIQVQKYKESQTESTQRGPRQYTL